ncbi:hypothetical protein BCR34DRAFT_265311 [Clohesyomyces aquaticus]|uniref:Uncharacterized protein n=1 Tax=Clohesyomyces aquaticus TaxID=1231657 RepID=A0A1Y1ZTG1_9PLEO|nr:hypothetical protein BCR34DRAFT_265311 [Clohesyomyces aquaticus]
MLDRLRMAETFARCPNETGPLNLATTTAMVGAEVWRRPVGCVTKAQRFIAQSSGPIARYCHFQRGLFSFTVTQIHFFVVLCLCMSHLVQRQKSVFPLEHASYGSRVIFDARAHFPPDSLNAMRCRLYRIRLASGWRSDRPPNDDGGGVWGFGFILFQGYAVNPILLEGRWHSSLDVMSSRSQPIVACTTADRGSKQYFAQESLGGASLNVNLDGNSSCTIYAFISQACGDAT